MSENKCCGNCRYFKDEDVNGEGFCEVKYEFEGCYYGCDNHEFKNNGWIELTPDNVKELCESKRRLCVAFVCNGEVSYTFVHSNITLSTMAKYGGYYYYVLPEFKLEERIWGEN